MRLLLTAVLLITCSCTTMTYTPAESATEIARLQTQIDRLKNLHNACESDLTSCTDLLKQCAPLIPN